MQIRPILIPPEVERLAREGAYFAFSISGGKDGNIAAEELDDYLDSIEHPRDRRLFIHADLGLIEWSDSGRMCVEVAKRRGLPLHVVRHKTHTMISRWKNRFEQGLKRYADLRTVTLIGPWSSSQLRFCTSELKTSVIAAELVKLVPRDSIIVSVVGIRGDESPKRALQPVFKADGKLKRKRKNLQGFIYRPIHQWSLLDVLEAHQRRGLRLHEAYTRFKSNRVSCAFCIMGSEHDLNAATDNPENIPAYLEVVDLELESGFSFQGNTWLSDVRPNLLPEAWMERRWIAQARRANRIKIESVIPEEMLYVEGWPTFVPTLEQCDLLAKVRRQICSMYGVESVYLTAGEVQARYRELFHLKRVADKKPDGGLNGVTKGPIFIPQDLPFVLTA